MKDDNSVFDMNSVCILWALHEAVDEICKKHDKCGACPMNTEKGKPCLNTISPSLHEIGDMVELAGMMLKDIPDS